MKIKIFKIQKSIFNIQNSIVKLFVLVLTFNLLLLTFNCVSQTGISIYSSGASADNTAILDISSTSQGLLIPRMTTEHRDAITSPALSLLIFNTTTNCFEAYVNSSWFSVSCAPCSPPANPKAGVNIPSKTQITWHWEEVSEARSYKWATTSSYIDATDVGTTTSYTQSGLACNTFYSLYVWAYNDCGSSDATVLSQMTLNCSFSCGNDSVVDADGNYYNTVLIGTQCWFQKNLAATKYNDNTSVPNVTDGTAWSALSSGAYCWPNNDYNTYGIIYGALYNWFAVSTGKLCPGGWHVPSHDEWTTLERTICTSSTCASDFPYDNSAVSPRGTDEGGKIKESGYAHWKSPNLGATNSSGFTALPAGQRMYSGLFLNITAADNWWTSTVKDATHSWYRAVRSDISKLGRDYGNGNLWGQSVRCMKD
jgi:uncharacterized protein (TIGR02145 family)